MLTVNPGTKGMARWGMTILVEHRGLGIARSEKAIEKGTDDSTSFRKR